MIEVTHYDLMMIHKNHELFFFFMFDNWVECFNLF
jgi:hypothetical protein